MKKQAAGQVCAIVVIVVILGLPFKRHASQGTTLNKLN